VDAYDVVNAVNSSYNRTSLFRPGLGADGPCLSKDPVILKEFAASLGFETPLLDASRDVNIASTHRIFEEVQTFAAGRPLSQIRVAILGLAFKGQPETDDVRGSPAEYTYSQLLRYAEERSETFGGFKFYDPVVESFGGLEVSNNVSDCVRNSNVILILTNHPALRNLDGKSLADCAEHPLLMVDAWHNLSEDRLPSGTDVRLVRIGDGR
jgi:UDP-N-acetyl-D-mannosaminuronate dehydrogenase